MSKKNSFGKLLAFTTTVAAIGGVCYVFRDQIKESSIYKKACDQFSNLRSKVGDKFATEDDDFIFDEDFEDDFEDDVFAEDAKKNREYTSITINAKEDTSLTETAKEVANDISKAVEDLKDSNLESSEEVANNSQEDETAAANDITETVADSVEDMKEIFADATIPTISFGNNDTNKSDETAATEEPTAYENEGLSDVSEDPDVLADMDRLDF